MTEGNQSVLDVIIIGAGISGIGAACHLQKACAGKSYLILEARADLGGTWDLFRYPGIRSDSDLFTFGYAFKPWKSDKAIADGAEIKAYIAETARENGVDAHIRYRRRVTEVNWSSFERVWKLLVVNADTGEQEIYQARWLFAAAGYYRYDQGFSPVFAGRERFAGPVVHPQTWPSDLDWAGKQVVVIGSGATAVTLVPAMARTAAHVTMLQRTPTYVLPVPLKDPLAARLRPWLGDRLTYRIARRVNMAKQRWLFKIAQKYPEWTRRLIRKINERRLPPGYPVDVHFNPPYAPWDQRLCAVPNADLFVEISKGRASIVTDRIATFTETGIALESGEHLQADLIVTATGLNLMPLGGMEIKVNDRKIQLPQTVAFKGMMLSGVPNFAFAVGYTASSWTLKVDLVCEHFCRILNHMKANGFEVCEPVAEPDMETEPLLNFGAGYVKRSQAELPRQGKAHPWNMSWNYFADRQVFRHGAVDDEHLYFAGASPQGTDAGGTAAAQA